MASRGYTVSVLTKSGHLELQCHRPDRDYSVFEDAATAKSWARHLRKTHGPRVAVMSWTSGVVVSGPLSYTGDQSHRTTLP